MSTPVIAFFNNKGGGGKTSMVYHLSWMFADRGLSVVAADLRLPAGLTQPIGYMVLRHSIRLDRPVKAYDRWIARIPSTYRQAVLDEPEALGLQVEQDEHCIAKLKDFRSLMPLSQEARKPMFFLKPADGALGAHSLAVQEVYQDFRKVASVIAERTGLTHLA